MPTNEKPPKRCELKTKPAENTESETPDEHAQSAAHVDSVEIYSWRVKFVAKHFHGGSLEQSGKEVTRWSQIREEGLVTSH